MRLRRSSGHRRASSATVARFVGATVAWSVILVSVLALGAAVLVPRLVGATPYAVMTGSMRPERPPGTLVVVRPVPISEIRVGDVITYQLHSGEPEVVTHRVVTVGTRPGVGTVLQTQGDANADPDPDWVREAQVRGRVIYSVPLLGRLHVLLSGRQHQAGVLGVAAVLGGYAGVMFAGGLRDRTRRRDDQPAKETADA